MNDWRDQILKEFTPQVARLTLVADPDGLLLEEGVLLGIHERGFELIQFEDHVEFRYVYESGFRARWDTGENTDLVVVLRSASTDLNLLPYDLLHAGRQLSFNLGKLFPNLSYPVVDKLDRADLNALYHAQVKHKPGNLGDNATKEFALRHVFEITPELIRQPSDLLRVLLRRHYREQRVPKILDEQFNKVLRQNGLFADWPLERIVPDRDAFFSFLQERWSIFLDRITNKEVGTVHDDEGHYGCEYPGPQILPFEHDDVRIYIDNLFLDGLLHPVSHEKEGSLKETWMEIGILSDPETDRLHRIQGLIETVGTTIPEVDARHDDWLHFAYRWAELCVLQIEATSHLSPDESHNINALRAKIDHVFLEWIQKRYAGLHNQPPVPPVMLHHIPRYLTRFIGESQKEKVAFVLVDGLALDQWIVIREALRTQCPQLRFRENSVFAWVPTITSVSRQAAFAGKPPIYFPSTIHTTDKEATLWLQFWLDNGLKQQEVAYKKGLGDGSLDAVEELVSHPQARMLGLVVDKVDKIMHGMELGSAGMHNQVHQWATQGFMAKLFDLLLKHGFQVFLTSDHGNVEAKGYGRPAEGAVADLRGERVRVYPDELLRSGVKADFPDAMEWPAIGLPDDYLPLLAPDRFAFIRKGDSIVGHGGISIEELIVPLIQIESREA